MPRVGWGHCQVGEVKSPKGYRRLGGTIEDAPGEACDKTARLLGLAQPGGPSVENEAKNGNPKTYKLPRPLLDRNGCDMSFSGLKTALLRARDAIVEEHGGLPQAHRRDLCAAGENAVHEASGENNRSAIAHCADPPAAQVCDGADAHPPVRPAWVAPLVCLCL